MAPPPSHVNGSGRLPARDAEPEANSQALLELKRQARAMPSLTPAEVEGLLARAAQGDRASQDRLVSASLQLVIRLAEDRLDQGLSAHDLVQEGSMGLLEAIRGCPDCPAAGFETFARRKAAEQMDAALAAEAAAVKDAQLLVAAATDYEKAEAALRREHQRLASEAEIAEKLEWSIERTRYVAQVVADARRRHDEELLPFIDLETIDSEQGELSGTDD